MNSMVAYRSGTGNSLTGLGDFASTGIFERHCKLSSKSSAIGTSYKEAGGGYRRSEGMCSSPVIVVGGGGSGLGGVRPSSVETDESIVSRSPEAIDDQDLSDRVLDQILREHGGMISFGNAVQSFESCFEPAPYPPTKTKSRRTEGSLCRVCGDEATGMYFGALVCVPCKTFYLRYAGSNQSFSCKENRCCSITVSSRTNCKFCRYQKCLRVGMHRKERPCQVHVADGQQICSVCHDVANGVHFGVITCEGCKKFFRRGLVENNSYVCKNNNSCEVYPRTRNACRFCRYQKCLRVGMSREAIQMGRPSKPRFDKDTSSQESLPLGALVPFDPSANRPNAKQTKDDQGILSPGHSSLNAVVPFSQPFPTHLTSNQRNSMSTNSPGYSSGNGGGRPFPADVLDKTKAKDSWWNIGTYQPQQLSNVARSSSSGPWSSIDALNGGEMIQVMTNDEDCLSPKHELDDFTDDRHFGFESRDVTEQLISDNHVLDGESHSTIDSRSSLWKRGVPTSSEQSPLTVATVIPSSSTTDANSCPSLYSRIDAMLCSEKTPTDASILLDKSTTGDACRGRNSALARDPAEISPRRVTDLQFPLRSVIKIIHSSVANELPESTNCHMPMDIEQLMNRYKHYWLYDETGEDPFIVHYSNIYKEVIAAYKTFVTHSQDVNSLLRTELEKCQSASNYNVVDVQWIQDNVVPFYVELSIRYCRQLPGFSSFDLSDQQMLIRLGQSPSRILAAAVHWYRPDKRDFGDFLSWRRNDQFKRLMVEHAAKIHALELDLVEASLLNAALIIATDYPNLVNPEPIERQHQDLLAAYKTYTTGKLGTPNDRFRTVISHMRQVRHLGYLHYEMTKTKNMMAEDVTQPR